MQNEDYVLLIGAEVPFRERAYAGALRAAKGRDVFTVSNNILSPTLKYFDGYLCAKISDHEQVLQAVQAYEKSSGRKPLAVIPTNDFTVVSAAHVARHYGLAHNAPEVVQRCRDKYAMRECMQQAGLPVPRYFPVATPEQLAAAARQLTYPAIIKPRQMAGSLGVLKVNSESELTAAFEKSIADVQSIRGESHADETLFIVEEFIDYEYEVSVEVLNTPAFSKVVAVTDKYLGLPPHFVELGHVIPSRFSHNQTLLALAEQTCRCLGIRYGIAHFEAKVNAQGEVKIIEVAARTGGDCIMSLVEQVYGYNPYQLHVAAYLDPEMTFNSRLEKPAGVAAIGFMKARNGIIADIHLPQSFPPEVVFFNIMATKGQRVYPLESWKNREGIIQFYWPDIQQGEEHFTRHLELARQLSEETFIMEDIT